MTGFTPDKLPKALDTFVRDFDVEFALDTFLEAVCEWNNKEKQTNKRINKR